MVSIAVAMLAAALFLPSLLRPPPEQTNDSAALSPDAPPDDQAEEIFQSAQQAKGGGAGVAAGTGPGGATGSGAPPPEETTTTTSVPKPPAFGRCIGDPARQIESVYGAPCAPAFSGDNGGATAHNVMANEVRVSLWHAFGTPSAGPIPDNAPSAESATARTFRVLQTYFNKRYQTWGRKVRFYAGAGGGDTVEGQEAAAVTADTNDRIFAASHLNYPYCDTFARKAGPVVCNPFEHKRMVSRPNFYSFMMDISQSNGFGAELVCKSLVDRPAVRAGGEAYGADPTAIRKISLVTENSSNVGHSIQVFAEAYQKECGRKVHSSFELQTAADPNVSSQAVIRMKQDKVTTVLLNTLGGSAIALLAAADSIGYRPEWVIFGNYGLDLNQFATLYSRTQSPQVFGLSGWELPRRFPESECYQAYRSIEPTGEPDQDSCRYHWQPMVVLMNGIQEAGPRLTPKSFEAGWHRMGRRYPPEVWAIGGGYGPDDVSYMDDMYVVWYDNAAVNPENNALGAYRYTNKGRRYKRGQLLADDPHLFRNGLSSPSG